MAASKSSSGAGGGGGGKDSKNKKKGGVATTPSLRDCANCGASEGSIPGSPTHKPCSKCKITFYCSTKCQKEHWKAKGGHKQHCVAVADRGVAPKASNDTAPAASSAAARPLR